MIARIFIAACLATFISAFTPRLNAEIKQWQGFEIHFTTLSSLLIPVEVADVHGIVRSRNRIVTNIAIRKNNHAVQAELTGTCVNLLSQLFKLEFNEIYESGAVYYLSNQLIDERDTLIFEIDITPADHPETFHLKFTRQYY